MGEFSNEEMAVESNTRRVVIHIIDGKTARAGARPTSPYIEFIYVRRTAVVNGAAIFEPESRPLQ